MTSHSGNDSGPPEGEDQTTHLVDSYGSTSDAEGEDGIRLNLPGYQILRKLGSGGMGQVYLARQVEPVDRQVAIKLILKKISSPTSEVRFLVERQALAQMHHPAIAQIFDGGTTPDGFPYFAMEYVPGLALTEFCDQHQLDLRRRLELFIRVCQGVSHAHQKGIIHRDLKPANILVSLVDDVPSPKIIDFGIATAASAADKGGEDSSAGTPLYMSPELFDEHAGIDIRSDVYSLGVILHELLAGRRPYGRDFLNEGGTATLGRRLIEAPPPLPSGLMAGADASAAEVAARRGLSARALERRLRGDLDAIAARAVHADREKRYGSAVDLTEDIRNYLAGRPVRAMGTARLYRARRFIRRHVLALTSAALIALSLVAGLTLAVLGMTEARQAQHVAEQRAEELEKMIGFQQSMIGDMEPRLVGESFVERLRAQYQQSFGARAEAETVEAGMEAFEVAVGQINPTDLAQDLLDEFMLQRAIDNIESDFAGEPALQADLYESVRDVYDNAGMIEHSLPLAERIVDLRVQALGADHRKTLRARQQYYRLLSRDGDYEAAGVQLDEVLARMDRDDPEQLILRHDAWDSQANHLVNTGQNEEALAVARENIERAEAELGSHHRDTARALNTLGYVHALSGDLEAALEQFRASLERAREHFDESENAYYSPLLNVGAALSGLERFDEALEIENEAIDILSTHFGRRNPSTIRAMNNKAVTLLNLERFDEAVTLLEEILELGRETYGRHSPITLHLQQTLGDAYFRSGDYRRALAASREAAEWHERLRSPTHPDTLSAREDEARALLELGEFEAAAERAEFIHQAQERGDADADTLARIRRLAAETHQRAGDRVSEMRWREMLVDEFIDGEPTANAEALGDAIGLLQLHIENGSTEEVDILSDWIRQGLDQGGEELDALRRQFTEILSG